MPPSMRQFRHVEPATVFDKAESALRSEGFRIAQRDRASGTITAFPVGAASVSGERVGPTGLSSANRCRRLAIVRIIEGDGIVKVSCRVEQQEMVTEARWMFEQHLGGFDRADDTPIDRGASSTREQNTAWKATGQDRGAEHRILAAIANALQVPSLEPTRGAP